MRAQIYVSSSASPLLKSFDLEGGGGGLPSPVQYGLQNSVPFWVMAVGAGMDDDDDDAEGPKRK